MDAETWNTATHTQAMIDAASRTSGRKFRLFMAACCRNGWSDINTPVSPKVIELAEQAADGRASKKALENMWDMRRGVSGGTAINCLLWPDSKDLARAAVEMCRGMGGWRLSNGPVPNSDFYDPVQAARHNANVRARNDLLRDIVGNPFRPVAFAPRWRSSIAIALADRMYVSRDFGLMPILADALEDAGCDNADVLGHCRDPAGVHVRGCWVVDLVLGKA